MLFAPPPPLSAETVQELAQYSRSLHDYTLRLWTESRRLAEEKAHGAAKGRRAQQRFAQRDSSGSSEESEGHVSSTVRRGSDSSSASAHQSSSETSQAAQRRAARGTSRTRSGDDDPPDRERLRKHRRTDGSSVELRARLAAVTI